MDGGGIQKPWMNKGRFGIRRFRRLFGSFLAAQKGTQPVKSVDPQNRHSFLTSCLYLRPQSTGWKPMAVSPLTGSNRYSLASIFVTNQSALPFFLNALLPLMTLITFRITFLKLFYAFRPKLLTPPFETRCRKAPPLFRTKNGGRPRKPHIIASRKDMDVENPLETLDE